MKNKLGYRIENGSLIIDNYFNDLKIGSIDGGRVENILKKCKLYDEEYETFLKENEYMKHIAKDFEQLQQENKKLNGTIQTYDILLKANVEENKQLKDNWNKLKEYIDIKLYNVEYLQKLCGCRIDDEIHMILDIIKKEIQELEQGSDSNE